MKKLTIGVMSVLLLTTVPMQISANTSSKPITTIPTNPVESEQAQILLSRLDEIKAIDKSDMKPAEKKQLRKEVRSIKSQLKEIGGGIYISVGAILIILLLLIILF